MLGLIRNPLVVMSIIGLLLSGTYLFGYKQAKNNLELQYRRSLQADYQEWQRRHWREQRAAQELTDKIRQEKNRIRVIKERVNIYVKPDKDKYCNLNVNTVRLLNSARDSNLPAATDAPVGDGGTPTDVGQRDLILSDIDIAEKYNALRAKHNALIKWLRENYSKAK